MAGKLRQSDRLLAETAESAYRTRSLPEEFPLGQRQGGQERDADGKSDKVRIGSVAKNQVELGHGIRGTVRGMTGTLLINPGTDSRRGADKGLFDDDGSKDGTVELFKKGTWARLEILPTFLRRVRCVLKMDRRKALIRSVLETVDARWRHCTGGTSHALRV